MKVLISGAAGFIASHLVDGLYQEFNPTEIIGIDNLWWGDKDNIHPKIKFKNLDILNTDKLIEYMHGVDVVIHCAASLEVSLSQDDPAKDLKINTMGTISVLEAMRKAGVKRLVNFSSACVYGQGHYGMYPVEEGYVGLDSPHWGYGSSKLAAEIYCNQYAKTYGMNIIHIRPGIVCGPREWYGRVLTIFLKRALEGKELVVFGNGREERDFVHVYDIKKLVMQAIRHIDLYESSVFNGGTGKATTVLDVANYIGKRFNVPVIFEDVKEGTTSDKVDGRLRLPFEMKSMRLSLTKGSLDLGFIPRRTLVDIIDDEVSWLQTNLHKWEKYKV